MATQWYWRDGEQTKGPVSFQELAGMVRDLCLNEDDLVRPSYSKETDWQTTDSVVGLYHMAERVPVPRKEEQPVPELPVEVPDEGFGSELDDMFALAEQISDENENSATIEDVHQSPSGPIYFTTPLTSLTQEPLASQPRKTFFAITVMRRAQNWIRTHKLISVVAAIVAVVGGGWTAHAIGRSADVQRFQELHQILVSIEHERVRPQPEFTAIRTQIERVIREYPDALMREGASRKNPVKQKFLFISRDILPGLLKADLKSRSIAEHHVIQELDDVGVALGLR
jgi:hypothetical protein